MCGAETHNMKLFKTFFECQIRVAFFDYFLIFKRFNISLCALKKGSFQLNSICQFSRGIFQVKKLELEMLYISREVNFSQSFIDKSLYRALMSNLRAKV